MTRKKTIVIAVLLLAIAGGLYIYKEFNRTNTNVEETSPVYTLNANEIIKEFAENDSVAGKKYVGRIIAVNGIVKNVNKDDRGYYTVAIGDTASMSSVRCSVDSLYTSSAQFLKPGMMVKIKGNCTGFNEDELLGSDVIFNRCIVEK